MFEEIKIIHMYFLQTKINRKCNNQVDDDDVSVWFQSSNPYIKLTDRPD